MSKEEQDARVRDYSLYVEVCRENCVTPRNIDQAFYGHWNFIIEV